MFSAVTLVTLAIGIGANSAIFSVIEGVLIKPLPYPQPEELIGVWHTAQNLGLKEVNASPAMYFTFREENRTFQDMGLWSLGRSSVTGLAEPEQARSVMVTDRVLPLLGVQPFLGRLFTKQDDTPGGPETVILSHEYWRRKFGSDPAVVGRTLIVDSQPREVIGVTPPGFRFMDQNVSLILTFRFDRNKVRLGNFSYTGIARLTPGVTIAQANADAARMLPIMFRKFEVPAGATLKMFEDARITPNIRPLKQDVVGDVGNVLWILMGTIGVVLLTACANVANLLLVRAEGRQQELAIRAALGAGWSRIARELLCESLTLGVAGGALGLGLAYGALHLLVVLAPAGLTRIDNISIDPMVLLFTLAISLFAGLLFGLIPVLKYAGTRVQRALSAGGRAASQSRERHRARNALVVAQVALALVLLVSSGLMIRTFYAMKQVEPGFKQPETVQTLRISIPEALERDAGRVARMQNGILENIAAIPGVSSVGISTSITMDGSKSGDPIFARDQTYAEGKLPPIRRFKFITPGYFKTLGNRFLAGRDLTWDDIHQKRLVAIVSENLAREYWREPASALGKEIRENLTGPWREIIGVVGNDRDDGVDQKATSNVYWPLLMKDFWGNPTMIRRTVAIAIRSDRAGSESLLKEIRQAAWSVNSNLPLADVRTLEAIYSRSMARTSFTLVMLAIAGGMALLLGLVGIYGVISYSVSQRTREIGIRMALGAEHGELKRMFVRHALRLTGIGVAGGLVASLLATRLMSTLLFGVQPIDPMTYGAVSLTLVAAALIASYAPARKATAVDPSVALRSE